MRNPYKVLATVCVFLLISVSCATTTTMEPETGKELLAIGIVKLTATNFPLFGQATVNGERSAGIELTIADLSSGERFTVKAGSKGLFYFRPKANTLYQVISLKYTNLSGGQGAFVEGRHDGLIFGIGAENVYSLGLIDWSADDAAKRYGTMYIYAQPNPGPKDLVTEQFSQSKWLNYNWALADWRL